MTALRSFAGPARLLAGLSLLALLACDPGAEMPPGSDDASGMKPPAAPKVDRAALRERAVMIFGTLPDEVANPENPITEEKVKLGRMLYFDPRLSKNHDISCNTCHALDRHGVDGQPTSPGHRGQLGERNSPSVYNAALHVAQFWDGRAADVEDQAKGPVLNPVEMAMPSEEAVVGVLRSIPGYAPLFRAAFPEGEKAITYDNMAKAIGAFERRLITPSGFDSFLAGNLNALTAPQVDGLALFMEVGCVTCHMGPGVGGGLYRKLGLVKPYGTEDPGRFAVTGNELDRGVFKVPSLRNVRQTGPYLHDGSVESLREMIRIMGEHQLGRQLTKQEIDSIRSFLESLTGRIDPLYTAKPKLPESGPDTPAPDPS